MLRLKVKAGEALIKSQATINARPSQEISKRDETIRDLRAQLHSQAGASPPFTPNKTPSGITQIKDLQPTNAAESSKSIRINGSHYRFIEWDNDSFGGMLFERTSGRIFHEGKTYESTLLLCPYKLSVKGHSTGM